MDLLEDLALSFKKTGVPTIVVKSFWVGNFFKKFRDSFHIHISSKKKHQKNHTKGQRWKYQGKYYFIDELQVLDEKIPLKNTKSLLIVDCDDENNGLRVGWDDFANEAQYAGLLKASL